MHRINYIQTNIQHICNIGPLIQWYSEKTKERCTTGSPPRDMLLELSRRKLKKIIKVLSLKTT